MNRMLTDQSQNPQLIAHPTSFRHFVLVFVLVAGLLLLSGPVSNRLFPAASRAAVSASAGPSDENPAEIAQGVREAHRRAAWNTIRRLESEARGPRDTPAITPVDLKRLRNALL
jgi:hypothetical protein